MEHLVQLSITHPTDRYNYTIVELCFDSTVVNLYLSYETCIAFEINGEKYVSENTFGTTTGRHINLAESDLGTSRKDRLKRTDFVEKLEEMYKQITLLRNLNVF